MIRGIFISLTVLCSLWPITSGADTTYCRPSESCWPDGDAITSLNDSLVGVTLVPGGPLYTNLTWMKSLTYTAYPGIIALVMDREDVPKCLKFAKKYNIRVTVLSSGHDYNGRSTANDSLQINFMGLKAISVNLTDSRSDTGATVTTYAGASWIEVYTEVDKYKKQVVGGSAHTVSVSGYTMGGGHSPICRSYGLAVDNVVAFDIVLHNGTLATCTDKGTTMHEDGAPRFTKEADLFWAVRGGGGGTFGVVVTFTFKLHEPPTGLVQYVAIYPANVDGRDDIGRRLYGLLFDLIPTLPREWGGYILSTSFDDPNKRATATISISMLQNAPWESSTTKAIDTLVNFAPEYKIYSKFTKWNTFLEYEETTNDPIYVWNDVANELIVSKDAGDDHVEFFAKTSVTPPLPYTVAGCTWTIIGGQTSVPDSETSSVSEHFRAADIAPTCWVGFASKEQKKDVREAVTTLDATMAELGNGAYLNEAAYEAVNWKERFWGSNYERLLAIKRRYDPDGVFTCHHCVGSAGDWLCPRTFFLICVAIASVLYNL